MTIRPICPYLCDEGRAPSLFFSDEGKPRTFTAGGKIAPLRARLSIPGGGDGGAIICSLRAVFP